MMLGSSFNALEDRINNIQILLKLIWKEGERIRKLGPKESKTHPHIALPCLVCDLLDYLMCVCVYYVSLALFDKASEAAGRAASATPNKGNT